MVHRRVSLVLLALILACAPCLRAANPARAAADEPAPPKMKRYFLALLYKGPTWAPGETPEILKLQQGHMANIERLASAGKLVLAGPFEDAGDLRGLFVLEAETIEEARALCASDPAVQAGRLRPEIYAWWTQEGRWESPAPDREP